MKVGVLGTGMVGTNIGSKLVSLGHQVTMGSQTAENPKAADWASKNGAGAHYGTFEKAASDGEIVFNCTAGSSSVEALSMAGHDNLRGKLLVDIANPLDFSEGLPPSFLICNTDSLGETIQRLLPETRVVKTLNTMNAFVMINPSLVPGDHDVFMSGNDQGAKAQVSQILTEWFGWKVRSVIDLGDISTARGTEMMVALWLRLWGAFDNPNFNFHVAIGPKPQML